MTDLGRFHPTAINDGGEVAGGIVIGEDNVSGIFDDHAGVYASGVLRDLGTLPGGSASWATDINNAGQVVGSSGSVEGPRAFIYDSGAMRSLGTLPGRNASEAAAVNDAGQTVGTSSLLMNDGGTTDGFVYENGVMRVLGRLQEGDVLFPRDVNSAEHVVGGWTGGRNRAFLYASGVTRDLGGLPNAMESEATAINNQDQVVGNSFVAYPCDGGCGALFSEPFLYEPSTGKIRPLGTFPGGETGGEAMGINDVGQVVGWSSSAVGGHAFVYEDGQMLDLNDLIPPGGAWELLQATAINNRGWIVATGSPADRSSFEERGFLLTPVGNGPGPNPIPLPRRCGPD